MKLISRRMFLKAAALPVVALALPHALTPPLTQRLSGAGTRLGRAALPGPVRVLSRPNPGGNLIRWLQPDEVVVILREVVGKGVLPHNHVWFEVDDGYVYSSYLQPVRDLPNSPLTRLPEDGVWSEITIPFVDAYAKPDPASSHVYRLYYSATFKLTELAQSYDGSAWYRVFDENGNKMYAPAEAFRPLDPSEIMPVSPEVENKRIEVYLSDQSLSAFENEIEIYHARISSGAYFFGEDGHTLLNGTPAGAHPIWSKRISRHMEGGTRESGYDLPGVAWVSYFSGNGAALHSTYWHNDFGTPKSHGCLNCRPEDAQWLFRWTMPVVPYLPGDITVDWANRGTTVDILPER